MTHDPRAPRPPHKCPCCVPEPYVDYIALSATASPSAATEGQPATVSSGFVMSQYMKENSEAAQSREAEYKCKLCNDWGEIAWEAGDSSSSDPCSCEAGIEFARTGKSPKPTYVELLAELSHVRAERDAVRAEIPTKFEKLSLPAAVAATADWLDEVHDRAEAAEARARIAEQALTLALEELREAMDYRGVYPKEWVVRQRERLIATATANQPTGAKEKARSHE